jgi:uncharacterized protein (DUF2147 family)
MRYYGKRSMLIGWRPWLMVASIIGLPCLAASAADLKDMIGRWRWQAFTIEVSACQGDGVCAKVIAGPKNVGMDVFASKHSPKGGDWFGQVTHPESKQVYDTRFQQKSPDIWRLDGCTAAKVCLSGEFIRVK